MGAILWQGPHHDAVKSTTTSLETHRNKRESTLERSRRRRRVRAECRRFGVGRGEGGWAPSFSEHALVGAADARIELRLGLELSHHDTRKKRIGERTSRTSNVYVGNEWGGGGLTLLSHRDFTIQLFFGRRCTISFFVTLRAFSCPFSVARGKLHRLGSRSHGGTRTRPRRLALLLPLECARRSHQPTLPRDK